MIKAEVITPWVGNGGTGNNNRPKIADGYIIKRWEDVTGQPSENLPLDQNMYTIKIECEESVLTQIESDNTYQVLWSEEIVNEIPE